MIHFFVTSSGKSYEFQTELFLRSLQTQEKNFALTVCGSATRYVSRFAEVIPLPQSKFNPPWYAGLTCVPQKGDITIYADADILIAGKLDIFHKPIVQGVIAYANPKIDWQHLFQTANLPCNLDYKYSVEDGACPYYVNIGFVAVPSYLIPQLNELLHFYLEVCERVYPGHYHRPQLSMCLALEHLKVNRTVLPIKYNFPDLYNLDDKDAVVFHLLKTRSKLHDWKSLKSVPGRAGEVLNRLVKSLVL